MLSQNVLTFDFETNKDGKVFAWSICIFHSKRKENKYTFYYGINIKTFIEKIKQLVLSKKNNKRYKSTLTIWGHNASKFDNKFILPELARLKYFFKYNDVRKKIIAGTKHIKSPYKEEQIKKWNKIPKNKKPYPYVKTIITNANKIMSLIIQFEKDKAIEFKDSMLFWAGSLNDYAQALGNKIKKEKQDWNKERNYNNVEELKKDVKFFNYLKNDVLILNQFLQKQFLALRSKDKRFHIPITQIGITGAQLAVESFYRYLPYNEKIKKLLNVRIGKNEEWWNKKKESKKEVFIINNKKYNPKQAGKVIMNDFLFPIKWQDDLFYEVDKSIKNNNEENDLEMLAVDNKIVIEKTKLKGSYVIGGLTTFNKDYAGKLIKSSSFDINSSYPNVLNGDYLVPYGEPSEIKNEVYNFGFYVIEILNDLTNTAAINFLNDANITKNIYPRVLKKGFVVRFGETMYRAFLKYYKPKKKDIKIELVRAFKSIKSKEIFGEWIDYFYQKKKNAKNAVEKLSAKLFLNSFYGKFITKQTRWSKIFNPQWKLKLFQAEVKDDLKYKTFNNVYTNYEKELATTKAKYYNPVGMSIVEQARVNLIDVKLDKKDFIYCDTDSIKLRASAVNKFIKDNKDLIDDTKLGKFKNEKQDGYLMVMEKKRYVLFDENKKLLKIVGSGFDISEEVIYKEINNEKIKVNFDDIKPYDILSGKIWFKNLKTELKKDGVVLVDNWKQIKPIWENSDDTKWFNNKEEFDKYWKKLNFFAEK